MPIPLRKSFVVNKCVILIITRVLSLRGWRRQQTLLAHSQSRCLASGNHPSLLVNGNSLHVLDTSVPCCALSFRAWRAERKAKSHVAFGDVLKMRDLPHVRATQHVQRKFGLR